MAIYYKKCKKYNEIQLTKNKMDLNIRKMPNNSPCTSVFQNTRATVVKNIMKMELNNQKI